MVTNAVRSRRRAAARSAREAAAAEQQTEAPAQETTVEAPAEETPQEQPTEATPEQAPAKATRTRKPKPEPEPEPEPVKEAPARTYTAWVAPTDRAAAEVLMSGKGPDYVGRKGGLTKELADAQERVARNRKNFGADAGNTIQAIGWHDRTVAKVLITLAAINTAAAKRDAQATMEAAQKLTGFGTAKSITRPGKQAHEALTAAEAKRRPARKAAAA